uniref:Fatty acid amide hydrolase 2b n=1 Tax=Cyprinus carpio TaxID=7962 RepID=A0A8C1IV43_CYPCA
NLGFSLKLLTPLSLIDPIRNPLFSLSAVQLAEKIRRREVTRAEVVQSYIDRIQEVNPLLDALEAARADKLTKQGCQTQFLEDRGPAEFSSNPAPTHIPCNSQFPPCSGLQNDYLGSGPKCRYAEDPLIYLQALPLKRGESKNVKFCFTVVDDGGAPLTSPVDNQLIQAQKRLDCIIYLMADEGSVWTVWELIKRIFGRSEHTVAAIGKLTIMKMLLFNGFHFKSIILTLKIFYILYSFWQMADGVLLYPSHPLLAHKHHHPHFTPHNFSYTSNNCLSLPVTQCPLGLSKERLLLAVQVVVGKLQDHLPLAVALYLEKAFGGWVNPGVTVRPKI